MTEKTQGADVEALNRLGLDLAQAGQYAQADQIFALLVGAGLADAAALKSYAIRLAEGGQLAQAETWIRHALNAQDADPVSHNVLSYCLIETGRHEEAAQAARQAIALAPRFADAHNNLGLALNSLGRNLEALEASQMAVRLQPGCQASLLNHGNVLRALGRSQEALAVTEQACAVGPEIAEAHYNRANLLQDVDRHADAVLAYDRAVAIDPNHSGAHWNRALCNLLLGAFEVGWAGYEWRWRDPSARPLVRQFECPLWLGQPDLAGRSILVHCEQGLGDALQFIRYAPLLTGLGAKVYVEAFAPLAELFGAIPGLEAVLSPGQPAPAVDFHCPLMSLPLALWSGLKDIPSATPYLFPTAEQRQPWRERLAGSRRPKIGLAYCGSSTHRDDQNRSIPLGLFIEALPPGADYFVLQTQLRDTDAELLQTRPDITWLGPEIGSFTDTAALCEEMDRMISVDTSLAHLAGALNRPLIVLLPHQPDWRWGLRADTTPWYPSTQLWRQSAPSDWAPVLSALHQRLQRVIADMPATG